MARIPYPDPATYSPELKLRLTQLGSLNITYMMSHAPLVMNAYTRLGTTLLHRGTLDPVVRELAILRIGQLCQSDYEWHHHESAARIVGTDEQTLEALRTQNFAALTAPQRMGITFAEEIKNDGSVSSETLAKAHKIFSSAELVELVMSIGYYVMAAAFLKTFDIEIEDTPPLGESFPR